MTNFAIYPILQYPKTHFSNIPPFHHSNWGEAPNLSYMDTKKHLDDNNFFHYLKEIVNRLLEETLNLHWNCRYDKKCRGLPQPTILPCGYLFLRKKGNRSRGALLIYR